MKNKQYDKFAELGGIISGLAIGIDKIERLFIELLVEDLGMPPEAAPHFLDTVQASRNARIKKENENG